MPMRTHEPLSFLDAAFSLPSRVDHDYQFLFVFILLHEERTGDMYL